MHNLYLYNKYVIYPQFLLKFPQKKNKLIKYGVSKIKMQILMVDDQTVPLLYLLNICFVIRIILNENICVKKLNNNKYTINKLHLETTISSYDKYIFIDLFKNFLMNSFELFDLGLNVENFDIYGNYMFEFWYYDPIFTTRTVITTWSPNTKIKILFCFYNKNKNTNKMYLKYLGIKFRFIKTKKLYY